MLLLVTLEEFNKFFEQLTDKAKKNFNPKNNFHKNVYLHWRNKSFISKKQMVCLEKEKQKYKIFGGNYNEAAYDMMDECLGNPLY